MMPAKQKLKVLIAYNLPPSRTDHADPDLISEAAVLDEANAVCAALEKCGHTPLSFPIDDLGAVLPRLNELSPDIIFNLCEGFQGQARHEAHLAGIWELTGIPYTGNPAFTLALAQNKVLSKQLFQANGIPTPPFEVFSAVPRQVRLNFPVIGKPAREDASLGITQKSVAQNLGQLQKLVDGLLTKYRQPVLVEELIFGREFNVSVIGNRSPQVLPVSEIDFSALDANHYPITSYEAKWLPDHPMYQKTPAICPARIDGKLQKQVADVARRVYGLLMGRDYGRVDMRCDFQGRLFVLEYNPNPDISPDAGLIRSVRASGMTYEQFIEFLLNEALQRRDNDQNTPTTGQ
jgi:D-alanine-D-alanine ligase